MRTHLQVSSSSVHYARVGLLRIYKLERMQILNDDQHNTRLPIKQLVYIDEIIDALVIIIIIPSTRLNLDKCVVWATMVEVILSPHNKHVFAVHTLECNPSLMSMSYNISIPSSLGPGNSWKLQRRNSEGAREQGWNSMRLSLQFSRIAVWELRVNNTGSFQPPICTYKAHV